MAPNEHWPTAVDIFNAAGASPVLLLCPHASNYIPHSYGNLGLPGSELQRHIGWDIGAAGVTRRLAQVLDAPAFLGTYSRLLIDLNRALHVESSIAARSEATDIPGNVAVTALERELRTARIFTPFHRAVETHLAERALAKRRVVLVAIHSFTPIFHGAPRAWHAGVLFEKSARFAQATIERLRAADGALHVGANVPYTVTPDDDYCLWLYADKVGNPGVEIEIRQDLLASPEHQQAWASRLAETLAIDVAFEAKS
jgi:predicted N-formylglutamate amidohydrolase